MTVTVGINQTSMDTYELRLEMGDRARVLEMSHETLMSLSEALSAHVEPRDNHHTMSELYHYRMLYNALAANEWARNGTYQVNKSWRHSDGEPCFGGGWFIVVADLPDGQVSNHYRAEFWQLFNVPELPTAPTYDGHTPEEAAKRMENQLIKQAERVWWL